MTIWRLELLRLFRTMRWVGLLASFVAFGILGPVLTRYQEAIFRTVGGGVTIVAPPPSAELAITSFVGNAAQIGLIVTVFIAAGSLVFDAKPEWSAFLRTRVGSLGEVVLPKVAVMAAAAAASFALGALAAAVGTSILIEQVPVAAVVAGAVCWALYLGFAVCLVALAAGLARSVPGAAGLTLVTLLLLPAIAEAVPGIADWSPSALVGAIVDLVGGASASDFLRAAAVTVALSAAALWGSVRLLARREV